MKSRLPVLLLLPLLCAAAPLPVRISPPEPVLGIPLLVTITLPDPEAELAGLPALGPFELLEPPRREGEELHLVLLPLRPGRHLLPSLTIRVGPGRHLTAGPVPVAVAEGVPPDAEPAPLRNLPAPPAPFSVLPGLGPAAGGLLLVGLWYLRRRRGRRNRPSSVPLEEMPVEELLAELTRRTARRMKPEEAGWRELAEGLERWRFGPLTPTAEEARRLLCAYRALTGGEA